MNVKLLGKKIRAERKRVGLSLAQLARRVNTTAATLCRYEKGWQRFEVYTLHKIATALGCGLEINITPIKQECITSNPGQLMARLQRLFWDKELTSECLREYPQWLVKRVLEYGNLRDVRDVQALLGRDVFIKTVAECDFNDAKTRNFWQRILGRIGVKCMKKSFPREANNFFPD